MDVTGAICVVSLSNVGLVRAHNQDTVANDLIN